MTPEAQRIAIAEACGTSGIWVLKKRSLYYRPGGSGYTSDIREAGRYSEVEAKQNVYPHDEPVTMHPAPLPDYLTDLNAMHMIIMEMDVVSRGLFNTELMRPFEHEPFCLDRTINATAAQRAEAFLRTLNLWEETTKP